MKKVEYIAPSIKVIDSITEGIMQSTSIVKQNTFNNEDLYDKFDGDPIDGGQIYPEYGNGSDMH